MSITIYLQGGLGNQLFQIAFLEYISSITGHTLSIEQEHISKHSLISYFHTIFRNWNIRPIHNALDIYEHNLRPQDWNSIIPRNQDIRMIGYFQNYKYITSHFLSKLIWNTDILQKYPTIQNSVFIHIRGGDYHQSPYAEVHNVDLTNYYTKAVDLFSKDTSFVVFTNDKDYVESLNWLKRIQYTIVDENELDSLYLMSKCKGGICANSTFSWWGAYLNRNRKLVLPSKWFLDSSLHTQGYYFHEAKIIEV